MYFLSVTQITIGPPMTSEFNRYNEEHMRLAKGLYYSWYGPKDAVQTLKEQYGIDATTAMMTRLFYNFRASDIPRHSRREVLLNYLSATRGV